MPEKATAERPTSASASEINGSLVPMEKRQAVLMLEAGHLWMDMGRFDAAREVLVGCTMLMPKSEVPQLALGTLEFVQGKHEKALQAYRQAQRLAPRSGLPHAHVGEVLLFMGKLNEAMKELKAAQTKEPDGDGAQLSASLGNLLGGLLVNLDQGEPVASELSKLNNALKKVKDGGKKPLDALIDDINLLTGRSADAGQKK
jgi:tetratricopeptide (TPR) repeat protein